MGIAGLLPFLQNVSQPCHVSKYKGHTVAVDTYCWLHKGSFGCAHLLARGEETKIHIQYCLKYVRMLQKYGVKPIMVFDGQRLKAKEITEQRRRENKKKARDRANELLRAGNAHDAVHYLRQCVDITHAMALALIKECRKMGVDCVVAPYEADAELAYLNMQGIAQAVITEDSDLILFGCSNILFKLDLDGNCISIDKANLNTAMDLRPDQYSFDKFRYMCIISGCDYLDSLPGVGLKRAYKAVALTHNPDIYRLLPRLGRYLNMAKLTVTEEYIENFKLADATLKHQLVYDPIKRKQLHLTDPEECGTDSKYLVNCGVQCSAEKALQLALGNIDPSSLEVLDDWDPDNNNLPASSLWSRDYKKPPPKENIHQYFTMKTTESVHVSVDTSNLKTVNEHKDNYDLQLKQELQMYSAKTEEQHPYTKRHKVIEPEQQPEGGEQQPDFPFMKRVGSRTSKFLLNRSQSGEGKRSRFFPVKREGSPILASMENQETTETVYSDPETEDSAVEADNQPDSDIGGSRTSIEKFRFSQTSSILSEHLMNTLGIENLNPEDKEATASATANSFKSNPSARMKRKEEAKMSVGQSPRIALSQFKKKHQPSITSFFSKR